MGDSTLTRADRTTRDHGLARLIAVQAGVFTSSQLLEVGYSTRTISRQVSAGLLLRRGRDVLIHAATPLDLFTESLAAAHRAGPGAVLAGPSAIAVQGLAKERLWRDVELGEVPWLTCAQHVRAGARLIRRPPPPGVELYGVRVAREAEALVDLLRLWPEEQSAKLADRAVAVWGAANMASLLAQAVDELGRAQGTGRLRGYLIGLSDNAQSEAEREIVSLLQRAELTGWRANVWLTVAGRRVCADVLFDRQQVIIEVNGRAWHGADRREDDERRRNLLEANGWRVLQFSWWRITQEPQQVIAEICATLGLGWPS